MKARLSCYKYETIILDLFVVRKSKRSFMRNTLNIQILENVEKIINSYKHIGGDGCLRACPALAKDLSSVPSFHFE